MGHRAALLRPSPYSAPLIPGPRQHLSPIRLEAGAVKATRPLGGLVCVVVAPRGQAALALQTQLRQLLSAGPLVVQVPRSIGGASMLARQLRKMFFGTACMVTFMSGKAAAVPLRGRMRKDWRPPKHSSCAHLSPLAGDFVCMPVDGRFFAGNTGSLVGACDVPERISAAGAAEALDARMRPALLSILFYDG